jgi:hypothetical protein
MTIYLDTKARAHITDLVILSPIYARRVSLLAIAHTRER